MMTPQQRELANQFLNSNNKEQMLKELMQKNGITQQQVDDIKKLLERR